MAVPNNITDWVRREYPKPTVNPEWLNACYNWLLQNCPPTEVDRIMRNISHQILRSMLSESMLPGTGLPANISTLNNEHIRFPTPVLVEIVSITQIAHSAFSLTNTRQMRIEHADLVGLGMDDEDQEGAEEEGPVPEYPRGMLKFELSDGATIVNAIEYRSMPELKLGVTHIGYKMLLKEVFLRRGIVFLEPKCVILKGGTPDERNEHQDRVFYRNLRLRLGETVDDDNEDAPVEAAPVIAAAPVPPIMRMPPPPVRARSPLHEIPRPPKLPVAGPSGTTHDDDEYQPRRRRVPVRPPSPPRPPPPPSVTVRSAYFRPPVVNPAAALARTRLFSPTRVAPPVIVNNITNDDSSEFGDIDLQLDDAVLAQLERAEQDALDATSGSASSSTLPGTSSESSIPSASSRGSGPGTLSGSSRSGTSSGSSGPGIPSVSGNPSSGHSDLLMRSVSQPSGAPALAPMEVITIDEEEDDKENVPVPTRHVRRRTMDVIDISD